MTKWAKVLLLTLLPLFLASSASAQGSFFSGNAYRYTPAGIFAASGATVQICTAAGTGTPCTPTISLFKDAALSIPATNPLSACSGTPPQFGCVDGLGNFSFYASTTGPYVYTITGAGLTAYGPIPIGAITSGSLSANNAFTGNNVFTSINNIKFCDTFVGADASAKIQACINALPAAGGIADAHNLTDIGGTGSTVIDPGATKAVTLLLGPYTYQNQQIVLRSSFRILGAGDGQTSAPGPMTVLQSCATCGAIAAFVMGGSGPVQGVVLDGFRVYATAANAAQLGFNITVNAVGAGLWYSTFRNLCIGACGPGLIQFMGGDLIFDGTFNTGGNGVHQFNDLHNVKAFRSSGAGSYALALKGENAQFTFDNCEFDGSAFNDGGTNIFIGDSVAGLSLPPDTIHFTELTCQLGSVCASIAGAWNITFHHSHIENQAGVWLLTAGLTNKNANIGIEDSYIATSGVNAGGGYIVKNNDPNGTVNFSWNLITNGPDAIVAGTNILGISGQQNYGLGGIVSTFGPTVTSATVRQFSGAVGTSAEYDFGRTAVEHRMAAVGVAGNFFTDSLLGDLAIRTDSASQTMRLGTGVANSAAQIKGSRFKIIDMGQCTMGAGTCTAQDLNQTYTAAPRCWATWTGTGALAGQIKIVSTTNGGTAGVGSVTPSSSNGADTAQVNWFCFGN